MSTPRPTLSRISGLSRLVILFVILAVGASAFYRATSSKSSSGRLPEVAKTNTAIKAVEGKQSLLAKINEELSPANASSPAFMLQAEMPPSIATYATDTNGQCTATPKTAFVLGETVCAKVTGANVTSPAIQSLTWSDPSSNVMARTDLETLAEDTFVLPATDTSVNGDTVVDNRGTWQLKLVPVGRYPVRASAVFTVSNATTPATDLMVYTAAVTTDSNVPASSDLTVQTSIVNFGPDDAATVEFTQAVPSNATFISATQDGGTALSCVNPASGATGTSVCTVATLPSGARADFTFVYAVGAAPKGTVIASLALVSSATAELHAVSNSSTASAVVTENPSTATCAVGCPANITVTAASPSGTVVNFAGDIESSGDCGTVTSSPASGTLFPVGTTTVSVTTGEAANCSFTVTVIDTPAPTIDCADDQTAQATGSELGASVVVNSPTATGTNVVITGVRNDNRALTDNYPIGTTTITWTARECLDTPLCEDPSARSASCTQKIIVTSPDAPTISCPTDKTFTASGCDITLTAGDIGTPTTTGIGVELTSRRSDDLALTDPFPIGPTTITWTATDDIGRVASCPQTITVSSGSDTTPPTLNVPADLTVFTGSCSALLDDELGVATAEDNCSSVSITRTGVPSFSCPIPGNPTRMCESFVFPVGTTVVTYTAKDGAGNTVTGTQNVTVKESPAQAPTVSAPADVTLFTGPGATSCGINVSNLDATLGTATASDNCAGVTVARSGVPAGNNFPIGPTTITYTATDASGNTAFDTQTVTVVDNTVPTISAPADVTLYTGPGATSCDVTVANLDTTLGTATANDNCPGVTVARGNVPAGNTFPLGETIVSYTATDANGNSSAPVTQKVTVVDNTPPVVTPPPNITVQLPLNSTATSMVVNYPIAATATDNCAGTITFNYSPASGSVFNVGPTTVTVTATDAHGNSASATFTVTVLYNFTGFFSPVGNLPTLNVVNAGRAIPVKFSLSGNKGLGIFAANNPYTVGISCNTTDPAVDITETLTAGGSSLSYAPDQYNYTWKTESSWAGTCRQLVVTLNDGSVHRANFKFK